MTPPHPTSGLAAPPTGPGSPWQKFYQAVLRQRRRRARSRAQRLPRPVISVGNLHWGGTGKTPITEAIARTLRDLGSSVVILSRGYGRTSRGPLIVSRGQGPLVDAAASGDEPQMLARRLDGVSIVVGARRHDAGLLALEHMPCDVFILDDGFSHVHLARDLDLLLFPLSDPWAGGRLPPSGRLREPLTAVRHADAVMITGVDACDPEPADSIRRHLATLGWSGPTFNSKSTVRLNARRPIERALLVSAVARPESVERSARELADHHGFTIDSVLTFPDHHAYPEASLASIRSKARTVDTVLVTSKDLVKFEPRLGLPPTVQLAELDLEATPELRFFDWLTTVPGVECLFGGGGGEGEEEETGEGEGEGERRD